MDKLNIISLDKKNDKKKNKLNKIENEEKQDEGKNKDKENINSSKTKKNYLEINQEEIKLKLLKILFGEKSKNKIEEQKIYNIKEKNDKKFNDDESQKIFYETTFNFHKSRLPKIKFRNTKDIQTINNKHNNNKEIKNKIIENESINENLNENLNINKEKKKMKKVVKKKVKKKKKEKIKKEEKSENYESNIERGEEEAETSTQEERLSKSVQERKVDNKKYFDSKENEQKEKKEKKKDKEKVKIKEEEKKLKEINNEKQNEIKYGKKEIVEKLIKVSGKKIFDDKYNLKNKAELNLSSPFFEKDRYDSFGNSYIKGKNEEIIKEDKNDSLLKREQAINARLINNNTLSQKEKIRRKQLEKDLEAEINKDELSDEPFDESEIDYNNKNEEEIRCLSDRTRKIKKRIDKNIDKYNNKNMDKNKSLYNSLIDKKKIYNTRNYRKFKLFEKKIYTPKKAVLSRESSKSKTITLQKNKYKKENTSFNTSFNSRDKEKKTKFKIFNDNCINKKMVHTNTNTLDFNQISSMDLSSYFNYSNININDSNNLSKKIIYIKRNPGRNQLYDNSFNSQIYDSNRKKVLNNYEGNNYKYFNNNQIKKILIRRFNHRNNTDISFSEQNMSFQSNEPNSKVLNETKDDCTSNTFYINTSNIFNIKKNIQLNANNNNNNSFTFRKHIKILNPLKQSLEEINLEDLFLIENKYFNIIHNLGEKREIANDCFDLFNFYYNCSLYQSLSKMFNEPNIIKLNINYTLMSLLISYDLSFKREKLKKIYLLLLEMFIINYKNVMLIAEFIINKVNNNSENSIWINKLTNKIIKYKESQEGEDIDSYNNFGLTINEKIKYNTHYLMQKIHYILLNYEENNNNNLLFFLKTINANSYDKIGVFFKENIVRENFGFSSILASSLIKNSSISNKLYQPQVPYISFPSIKKYSLILDLDETLIYLDKIRNGNNGTLKIRPGTFLFLEKIKKYYEIIIFSEAEQNYVDLILNSLEENGKYFDYVLYRQHTTIQNEEFIKDLNKIGRQLSNVVIVDNMPQNFRLQKQNGIYIKPFWGTDNDDDVLFYLGKVLIQIANEGGDIRNGLKKYKKEIIINISSSYRDN